MDDFWYPQRGVFNDFGNFIDNFFDPQWGMKLSPKFTTFKVDIKEKDKAYVIEAELPGVSKEDVNVKIDDNHQAVNISVKHNSHSDEIGEGYIHRERHSSSMSRSIRLPDAKFDNVRAKLENGILTLIVAKCVPGGDGSRKITIE